MEIVISKITHCVARKLCVKKSRSLLFMQFEKRDDEVLTLFSGVYTEVWVKLMIVQSIVLGLFHHSARASEQKIASKSI